MTITDFRRDYPTVSGRDQGDPRPFEDPQGPHPQRKRLMSHVSRSWDGTSSSTGQ